MIDLSRSVITVALGIYDVDPTANFNAGQFVKLGVDGKITNITSRTDNVFGMAKWNKLGSLTFDVPVINEQVVLVGTSFINLQHGSIVNGSVRVVSMDGATVYTENTDYTINYVNGQIARVGSGGIADGSVVLVSYRYNVSNDEIDMLYGKNWYNNLDDSYQVGKMTVIQDFAIVYTDAYITNVSYVVGGDLFIDDAGFITSDGSGGATKVGVCVKMPSVDDPFIGIKIG